MHIVPSFFELLLEILRLFLYALFFSGVVSTLIAFGILDSRNRIVWSVNDFLYRVTDPAVRPVRRVMPSFGGVDLSILVVMLLIYYILIPLVADIGTAVVQALVQS